MKIDAISILNKIEFKNLKILNLSDNEVSNLSELKSASFKNIEILNLEKNLISDISFFIKLDLVKLKELYLS